MRVRALFVLVAGMTACGGSAAPRAATPPSPSPGAIAATTAGPATTDRGLSRSAVKAVVARGLGAFLQRIELADEPVFLGGRFHGFRIAAFNDPAFWAGVDLKVGDVVTSVNGMPIERPEQALAAFDSLQVASELRVSYERQGRAASLVYPIVDDR